MPGSNSGPLPPTALIKQGDMFDWLRILKKEGKIKAFGLSIESWKKQELCLKQEGVSSLQIIFNVCGKNQFKIFLSWLWKSRLLSLSGYPLPLDCFREISAKTLHSLKTTIATSIETENILMSGKLFLVFPMKRVLSLSVS